MRNGDEILTARFEFKCTPKEREQIQVTAYQRKQTASVFLREVARAAILNEEIRPVAATSLSDTEVWQSVFVASLQGSAVMADKTHAIESSRSIIANAESIADAAILARRRRVLESAD
jgi:hypothetical protein